MLSLDTSDMLIKIKKKYFTVSGKVKILISN